ncbi:DMT family transporter [Dinoroseobacter sp. S375]|uniref:DMT family transporter n=1 Tax=Dinoroseobacter sp. S375 TaxID=3415136 RepID=UPI003C7C63E9
MSSRPHPTETRYAVLAILLSVAALSLGDAVIKATGLALPLWQMLILRSALVAPVLWWLARRGGGPVLRRPHWALLRAGLLVAMWLCNYTALPLMPLSLAAAAYYTGPLFIVVLAALVARRWPRRQALLAILAGFIGVLMVIRPDMSGFAPGTLLPVLAAVLYAAAMVLTAATCREENPFGLALVLNLSFVLGGAVLGLFSGREGSFMLGPWQGVDLSLLITVAGLALLILIGSVGAAIAYQKGPPATVAAFDYSYLVFSLIWGALFFAEVPGRVALLGIALILGAGLFALPGRKN